MKQKHRAELPATYYNDSRKNAFLAFLEAGGDGIEKYVTLFRTTAIVENREKKDICNFTYDEIFAFICQFETHRATVERKHLQRYGEWCRARGYCDDNPARMIKTASIEAATDHRILYLSPDDFEASCAEIRKKDANASYDLALWHCIYEGMVYEDTAVLRLSDIDFDTNTIRTANGTIKVSDDCIAAIEEAASTQELQVIGGDSIRMINRIWGDSVFGAIRKTNASTVQRYNRAIFKELMDYAGLDMTAAGLRACGIANYVYTQAMGAGLDFFRDARGALTIEKWREQYDQWLMEKNSHVQWLRYRIHNRVFISLMEEKLRGSLPR